MWGGASLTNICSLSPSCSFACFLSESVLYHTGLVKILILCVCVCVSPFFFFFYCVPVFRMGCVCRLLFTVWMRISTVLSFSVQWNTCILYLFYNKDCLCTHSATRPHNVSFYGGVTVQVPRLTQIAPRGAGEPSRRLLCPVWLC